MSAPPHELNRRLSVEEITPEAVTQRLSHRLRKLIGPGRRWSYSGVAGRTEIDIRTLKAYAQGSACPNLVRYKRLLAVLGPEIAGELNRMQGWLPRDDAVPPEALNLADLRDELARAQDILAAREGFAEQHDGSEAPTPPGEIEDADLNVGSAEECAEREQRLCDKADDTLPEFRLPLKVEQITAEEIARRIAYRLARIVGPELRWSVEALCEATGIDERTLRHYLSGEKCPNLARYYRLEHVIGPEFGVELAFMLGWTPRFGGAADVPTERLDELGQLLTRCVATIDDICRFAEQNAVNVVVRSPNAAK